MTMHGSFQHRMARVVAGLAVCAALLPTGSADTSSASACQTLACPAHDFYGYGNCPSSSNSLKCIYSDSSTSVGVACSGSYYCQYSSSGQLVAGGDHDGGYCAKTVTVTCSNTTTTLTATTAPTTTPVPTTFKPSTASPYTYATYIGCFADGYYQGPRVFPNKMVAENHTIGSCIQAAQAALNGVAGYAGVEYGGQCFYGTNKPTVTATNCDYTCTSDATENCGGYYAISTYALQGAASVAATPMTATIATTSPPACQTQGNFQQSCTSIAYNTTVGHCSITASCQNSNGVYEWTSVSGLTSTSCPLPGIQNCNRQLVCRNCDGTPYATTPPTTTAVPTTETPTTCLTTLACPTHDSNGFGACPSLSSALKCVYSDSATTVGVACSGQYYCQYASTGKMVSGGDHNIGGCPQTVSVACGNSTTATVPPTTVSTSVTPAPSSYFVWPSTSTTAYNYSTPPPTQAAVSAVMYLASGCSMLMQNSSWFSQQLVSSLTTAIHSASWQWQLAPVCAAASATQPQSNTHHHQRRLQATSSNSDGVVVTVTISAATNYPDPSNLFSQLQLQARNTTSALHQQALTSSLLSVGLYTAAVTTTPTSVPASTSQSSSITRLPTYVIAVIAAAGGIVLIAAVLVCWRCQRLRQQPTDKPALPQLRVGVVAIGSPTLPPNAVMVCPHVYPAPQHSYPAPPSYAQYLQDQMVSYTRPAGTAGARVAQPVPPNHPYLAHCYAVNPHASATPQQRYYPNIAG